jgi:hypothetical protein
MGAQGGTAFRLRPEVLHRCGGDEEVVRPHQVFDELGNVLDNQVEI